MMFESSTKAVLKKNFVDKTSVNFQTFHFREAKLLNQLSHLEAARTHHHPSLKARLQRSTMGPNHFDAEQPSPAAINLK
jgi:hypothetical protein